MQLSWQERGASSVEITAVVAVVAALMAAASPALSSHGNSVAAALGSAITDVVTSGRAGWSSQRRSELRHDLGGPAPAATAPAAATTDAGTVVGWRRWSQRGDWTYGRLASSGSVDACVACAGLTAGLGVDTASANAHLALARVAAHGRAEVPLLDGAGLLSAEAGVTGLIGADATAEVRAQLAASGLRLSAAAEAHAGARARAEGELAAELAGVAVRKRIGAEAWAGVGGTAAGHLEFTDAGVAAGGRLGGALGVGAAVDAEVEVRASNATVGAARGVFASTAPGAALALEIYRTFNRNRGRP